MKKLLLGLLMTAGALLGRADEGFLKSMPPEDYAAIGLGQHTPEQLARLEALVQRYKSGAVAAVQQAAETKVAATEVKVKAAEQKAAAAEARLAPAGKKQPGWLAALITLQQAGDKPDKAEAFETRIAGEFDGWTGRTTFRLENGQVWQQTAGERYYGDKQTSPKVKIYPGMLGVYWMEVEGVGPRVKVKPVRLE